MYRLTNICSKNWKNSKNSKKLKKFSNDKKTNSYGASTPSGPVASAAAKRQYQLRESDPLSIFQSFFSLSNFLSSTFFRLCSPGRRIRGLDKINESLKKEILNFGWNWPRNNCFKQSVWNTCLVDKTIYSGDFRKGNPKLVKSWLVCSKIRLQNLWAKNGLFSQKRGENCLIWPYFRKFWLLYFP